MGKWDEPRNRLTASITGRLWPCYFTTLEPIYRKYYYIIGFLKCKGKPILNHFVFNCALLVKRRKLVAIKKCGGKCQYSREGSVTWSKVTFMVPVDPDGWCYIYLVGIIDSTPLSTKWSMNGINSGLLIIVTLLFTFGTTFANRRSKSLTESLPLMLNLPKGVRSITPTFSVTCWYSRLTGSNQFVRRKLGLETQYFNDWKM